MSVNAILTGKQSSIPIVYIEDTESADSAFAKAEATYETANIVVVHRETSPETKAIYMPCIMRKSGSGIITYYFSTQSGTTRYSITLSAVDDSMYMWTPFAVDVPDSAPTAGSSNLVTSGGVKNAIDSSIIRPNLLRNWYFVGGGSQQGGGQFPINQREQTTYSSIAYTIDGWRIAANSGCAVSLGQDGITFERTSGTNAKYLAQWVDNTAPDLNGKRLTASILCKGDPFTLDYHYGTSSSSDRLHSEQFTPSASEFRLFTWIFTPSAPSSFLDYPEFYITMPRDTATLTIAAMKFEIGDTQTLAHNEGTDENPIWVLNEIPDYEEQLIKCETSMADPTDQYANKVIPIFSIVDGAYCITYDDGVSS